MLEDLEELRETGFYFFDEDSIFLGWASFRLLSTINTFTWLAAHSVLGKKLFWFIVILFFRRSQKH